MLRGRTKAAVNANELISINGGLHLGPYSLNEEGKSLGRNLKGDSS